MKRLLNILFILCVILSSCMEDQRQTGSYGDVKLQERSIAKVDTEAQAKQITNVDTVARDTVEVNASNTGNAVNNGITNTYQAQIPPQNSDSFSTWDLIAIGIGVISLVLCALIWYLMAGLERDVSHDIKDIRYNLSHSQSGTNRLMADRLKQLENSHVNLHMEVDKLLERLVNIESSMQKDASLHDKIVEVQKKKEESKKMGYFGMVKSGNGISMFNEYPNSRNDGAYFEVEYIDDEHCEFAPFDLDRIRSIDAVGEAVEYNGNMAYAKSLNVIQKGKAVFDKEHGFWQVTDKAIIELKH